MMNERYFVMITNYKWLINSGGYLVSVKLAVYQTLTCDNPIQNSLFGNLILSCHLYT